MLKLKKIIAILLVLTYLGVDVVPAYARDVLCRDNLAPGIVPSVTREMQANVSKEALAVRPDSTPGNPTASAANPDSLFNSVMEIALMSLFILFNTADQAGFIKNGLVLAVTWAIFAVIIRLILGKSSEKRNLGLHAFFLPFYLLQGAFYVLVALSNLFGATHAKNSQGSSASQAGEETPVYQILSSLAKTSVQEKDMLDLAQQILETNGYGALTEVLQILEYILDENKRLVKKQQVMEALIAHIQDELFRAILETDDNDEVELPTGDSGKLHWSDDQDEFWLATTLPEEWGSFPEAIFPPAIGLITGDNKPVWYYLANIKEFQSDKVSGNYWQEEIYVDWIISYMLEVLEGRRNTPKNALSRSVLAGEDANNLAYLADSVVKKIMQDLSGKAAMPALYVLLGLVSEKREEAEAAVKNWNSRRMNESWVKRTTARASDKIAGRRPPEAFGPVYQAIEQRIIAQLDNAEADLLRRERTNPLLVKILGSVAMAGGLLGSAYWLAVQAGGMGMGSGLAMGLQLLVSLVATIPSIGWVKLFAVGGLLVTFAAGGVMMALVRGAEDEKDGAYKKYDVSIDGSTPPGDIATDDTAIVINRRGDEPKPDRDVPTEHKDESEGSVYERDPDGSVYRVTSEGIRILTTPGGAPDPTAHIPEASIYDRQGDIIPRVEPKAKPRNADKFSTRRDPKTGRLVVQFDDPGSDRYAEGEESTAIALRDGPRGLNDDVVSRLAGKAGDSLKSKINALIALLAIFFAFLKKLNQPWVPGNAEAESMRKWRLRIAAVLGSSLTAGLIYSYHASAWPATLPLFATPFGAFVFWIMALIAPAVFAFHWIRYAVACTLGAEPIMDFRVYWGLPLLRVRQLEETSPQDRMLIYLVGPLYSLLWFGFIGNAFFGFPYLEPFYKAAFAFGAWFGVTKLIVFLFLSKQSNAFLASPGTSFAAKVGVTALNLLAMLFLSTILLHIASIMQVDPALLFAKNYFPGNTEVALLTALLMIAVSLLGIILIADNKEDRERRFEAYAIEIMSGDILDTFLKTLNHLLWQQQQDRRQKDWEAIQAQIKEFQRLIQEAKTNPGMTLKRYYEEQARHVKAVQGLMRRWRSGEIDPDRLISNAFELAQRESEDQVRQLYVAAYVETLDAIEAQYGLEQGSLPRPAEGAWPEFSSLPLIIGRVLDENRLRSQPQQALPSSRVPDTSYYYAA